MATHINITGNMTSSYGLTLGTGAEAEDVSDTSTVEAVELIDQSSGEVVKVAGANIKRREVQVSGDGPQDLTAAAVGSVGTTSTLTIISNEVSEAPNQRCRFSITMAGHAAFTDPGTSVGATGAEPTISDLEITSVAYTIAESIRRTYAVQDLVLVGTDGAPEARHRVGLVGTFSVQGRGDLPGSTAIGTGGAAFTGGNTGIVFVTSQMEGERRRDWNRWSVDGSHYKSAA